MSLENTFIWRLKLRLQFTGWLQYVINGAAALGFLMVAAIGALVGVWQHPFVWPPLLVGCLLLINLIFDLVTVKLGLHPQEAFPKPRTDLDAFDLMRARRACRSFQPRNLSDAHRTDLLGLAREESAPDRRLGKSPIRFEYVAAPLTVWPVVGAHEFLVAIAPREYDRVSTIDVGRSLQRVVLQATRIGVASCWIGPGADHKSVIRHLGDRFDADRDHIICVCALGYRSRYKPLFVRFMQASQHRRLSLESLFFADLSFAKPLDVGALPFREFGRCYEVCQWSPSSYNSQTTRCVAIVQNDGSQRRLTRFDFLAATASRYYAAVALGIWCANWEAGCRALGIGGHFAVLAQEDRGAGAAPALPHYDVSWILDDPRPA